MVLLHICSITNRKDSGISVVVPNHFINQSNIEGNDIALMNCNDLPIDSLCKLKNVFYYSQNRSISSLSKPFNHPDLVVFHGVYIKEFIIISKELRQRNIPYIIIPHGSLTGKAQKIKRMKKAIANFLFFKRFISKSSAVQFLTEAEAKESQYFRIKSFVCGNGINQNSRKEYNKHSEYNIVYIGRYDIYTKGIDILVSFASKNKQFWLQNKIKFVLYGTGDAEKDELLKLIEKNDCIEIVKVNGPIFGAEKEEVLKKADMFIQLSRSEGQPLGIMEAMSYGLPIIASEGTTFKEVIESYHCGIAFDENTCLDRLQDHLNDESLCKMGNNAYRYSVENLSWDVVAKKTLSYYYDIVNKKGIFGG